MEATQVSSSYLTTSSLQPTITNSDSQSSLDVEISADEIALYDRQIRLWGMKAQEKIRNANILLIGMKALANEIAKNLVLAGIHSLTIIDNETVSESDLGAQFFISESDVGKNRASASAPNVRKLNSRVDVHVDERNIAHINSEYYEAFDVVICTDLGPDLLNTVNMATRLNRKPFYAAGVHGFYGFIFTDLIQHDFVVERERSNKATVTGSETRTRSVIDVKEKKENGKNYELVTKREIYSTWLTASEKAGLPAEFMKRKNRLRAVTPILSCLKALWTFSQAKGGDIPKTSQDLIMFTTLATQKHKNLGLPDETLRAEVLRRFLQNINCEIAPVTAVLGGQLAQDVINVLGARLQPIQNMVIFDGVSMEAPVYALHLEGVSMEAPVYALHLEGALDEELANLPVNSNPQKNIPVALRSRADSPPLEVKKT